MPSRAFFYIIFYIAIIETFPTCSTQASQDTSQSIPGRRPRSDIQKVVKTRQKRAFELDNSCNAPSPSNGTTIAYRCPFGNCVLENDMIREFSMASIKCDPGYHLTQVTPKFRSSCLEKSWTNEIPNCLNCGVRQNNPLMRISGGETEAIEDWPWQVEVYNSKKEQICGGSILTRTLILTAAHCFFNRQKSIKLDPKDYEVVVGKFSRNYYTQDHSEQIPFKIRKIIYSDRGYYGDRTYQSTDIAILHLDGSINFSYRVWPICLPSESQENLPDGTLGKVAGWGADENGKYPANLLSATFNYISRANCSKFLQPDKMEWLSFDKFCSPKKNGTSVRSGDSGSGWITQENDHFVIQGVVSLEVIQADIFMVTDLQVHLRWVKKVMKEFDLETVLPDIKECRTLRNTSLGLRWPTKTSIIVNDTLDVMIKGNSAVIEFLEKAVHPGAPKDAGFSIEFGTNQLKVFNNTDSSVNAPKITNTSILSDAHFTAFRIFFNKSTKTVEIFKNFSKKNIFTAVYKKNFVLQALRISSPEMTEWGYECSVDMFY